MSIKATGRYRWIYPMLCFIITFLGGTLYSYSVIGYEIQRLWGVSATEVGIPYFAALGVYGYLMVLGGVLEKRFRSEKIPLYLGAILFGLGFTASSFVDRSMALFTVTYLVAGLGIALMDSMTLPIATSWVPDKPGLAVGIARTGFGIASLVVAPLFEYLFKVYGFNISLRIVGITYLAISITVAFLSKVNPEYGKRQIYGDIDRALLNVLSMKCFWVICILFFAGLFTPLAYIGYVKQIGVELVSIDPKVMGYLIAVFSIFNGLGRVLYGKMIDSRGFLFTATLNYVSMICALIALWLYPSQIIFIISSIAIYLNLGGWLVIAPTEVRSVTLPENYSLSWPLIMTGYATAVFIGTAVTGVIRDTFGSFGAVLPISLSVILVLGIAPTYLIYRKICRG
jgi:predicted MFS family arabinose efflux permease